MTTPASVVPATARLVIRRVEQNTFYRKAIETAEYREAIALFGEATRRRAQLAPIPRIAVPASPDDDLDEYMAIAVELDAAERERTVRDTALSRLITSCEHAIQSLVHQKDRLLTSLASDLDDILSAAGAIVAQLDGATNAAQAIERGTAQAWQQLPAIRGQYDLLRQAQDWAMAGDHRAFHARSEYIWDDDLASDLQIRNLDSIFASWKAPPQNRAIQGWDDQKRVQPWPDGVEQLVWMVTSDAEIWCPTTKQVDALNAERADARRHPNGEPKQQQERVLLNVTTPRTPDYSRVITPITNTPRPADLAS